MDSLRRFSCLAVFAFVLSILPGAIDSDSIRDFKMTLNDRPIIGILSQEVTGSLEDNYGPHTCYIAASYVKHLESAGARVVPIWIGKEREYYRNTLASLNGVMFPGGATFFNNTGGYADAGKMILEIADELNDQGDFFPVWGTCLGFELLAYLSNKGEDVRVDCHSSNQVLPLEFKPGFRESKMFAEAPEDVIATLTKENSTVNFHIYCVTEEGMEKANLNASWNVLSVNKDFDGLEFVSAMEHKTKPYFAVQFHPEKPAYEWKPSHVTPHGANAIRASQYFPDLFVGLARRNGHKFESEDEERSRLIYNFPVTYGKPSSSFIQLYFFDLP